MVYPDVQAGQRITAALWRAGLTEYTILGTSQDVTSSTTLTDITGLAVALDGNARYMITIDLAVIGDPDSGGAGGDIKTNWSVPSGASGLKRSFGMARTGTNRDDTTVHAGTHDVSSPLTYGTQTGFAITVRERVLLTTTDAGTLTPQFAQNTSDTDPVTVLADSYVETLRIG